MAGETFNGIPANEVNKMFDECCSNQDTPLTGRIYTPICHSCKNLETPNNPFGDCTCKVYGKPPDKYRLDDKEMCPYKIEE